MPGKRRFRAGLLFGLAVAALAFAYPSVFPTGVTLYDPARAYNTFVFFATEEDGPGQSFLIDMNGNEVHHWTRAGKMMVADVKSGLKFEVGVCGTKWQEMAVF